MFAPVLLGVKHDLGNEIKWACRVRDLVNLEMKDRKKFSKDLVKGFIASMDILV